MSTVYRAHRLVAMGRKIDDRKPAESQRNTCFGIGPGAPIVGAAVVKRFGHRFDPFLKRLGIGTA